MLLRPKVSKHRRSAPWLTSESKILQPTRSLTEARHSYVTIVSPGVFVRPPHFSQKEATHEQLVGLRKPSHLSGVHSQYMRSRPHRGNQSCILLIMFVRLIDFVRIHLKLFRETPSALGKAVDAPECIGKVLGRTRGQRKNCLLFRRAQHFAK